MTGIGAPFSFPAADQTAKPPPLHDLRLWQKARADAVEAISSVAVCTALCLQIDRYADTKLCSETMFGLSSRAVVKAIKAERPESTQSGSSLAPDQFTTMTRW